MMNKITYAVLIGLVVCCSCNPETDDNMSQNLPILAELQETYELLPEEEITQSLDGKVLAQYAQPTERYGHGILGDKIEAGQLVVAVGSEIYEITLEEEYVFEDIRPRLYDVDGDGELEIITIRTHVDKGAGIMIYKLLNGALNEYAFVEEIGIPNRWLNLAAMHDLDDDGVVEIAWIQTPHIGGILKVAKFGIGQMQILDETSLYSNHKIGERNLCLSALTDEQAGKTLYVPNQDRNQLVGFTFEDLKWREVIRTDLVIDFSLPLVSQFSFIELIEDEVNCINP